MDSEWFLSEKILQQTQKYCWLLYIPFYPHQYALNMSENYLSSTIAMEAMAYS